MKVVPLERYGWRDHLAMLRFFIAHPIITVCHWVSGLKEGQRFLKGGIIVRVQQGGYAAEITREVDLYTRIPGKFIVTEMRLVPREEVLGKYTTNEGGKAIKHAEGWVAKMNRSKPIRDPKLARAA